MQQGIQALIGFEPDVAAMAAIAARWSTARYEFFSPKGCDAVSAVSRFHLDLCSVYEHYLSILGFPGFKIQKRRFDCSKRRL